MTNHLWRGAIGLLCIALLAAACGSDGGSDDGNGKASDNGGQGGCQLDDPPKVAFLWEIKGESANGIDDYQNSAQLAVDEINRAGGVCGQKLKSVRVSASVSDPQKAVASYLQAVDEDPVAIIGPPSSVAADALIPSADRSQVPTILATANRKAVYGTSGGSEWVWVPLPPSSAQAETSARFAVDNLHAKKLAFLGTNENNGDSSLAGVRDALKGGKASLSPVRQFAPGIQDLTSHVLAARGADVVLDFGYPNDVALAVRQMQQNDLHIPVIDAGSGQVAALSGLIPKQLLDNFYATNACEPAVTDNPKMAAFTKAYRAKYGASASLPFSTAIAAYDMVKLVAKAIETAGSTDRAEVNDAIGKLRFTGGVCQSVYQADPGHFLAHELVTAHYSSRGTAETLRTFKLPKVRKGENLS